MRNLIAERLTMIREPAAVGAPGDRVLNPDLPRPEGGLIPAAVLVPLVDHPEGMTVLLTQRTADLPDHGGQISFPGGRIEPGDSGPVAAALRETYEEIGVGTEFIKVVGTLQDFETGTGFRISPVVGLLSPGFSLRPAAAEVAEVFEVPLDFVLDAANHRRESAVLRGARRTYYVLPYQDRRIWGTTAGLLVDLARRLAPA